MLCYFQRGERESVNRQRPTKRLTRYGSAKPNHNINSSRGSRKPSLMITAMVYPMLKINVENARPIKSRWYNLQNILFLP